MPDIGRGIESIVTNTAYVVRVDVRLARPFVVGSLLNDVVGSNLVAQRTVDYWTKSDLKSRVVVTADSLAYPPSSVFPSKPVTTRVSLLLQPMWISNGVFFFNPSRPGKPPKPGPIFGTVLQKNLSSSEVNGQLLHWNEMADADQYKLISEHKDKRWMYRQRQAPDGTSAFDFNAYDSAQRGIFKAQDLADAGFFSAIGGAAALIETDPATGRTEVHTRPRAWWRSDLRGKFDDSKHPNSSTPRIAYPQSYSTGPIIAMSKDKQHIYLIMLRAEQNWPYAATYLRDRFLTDINRQMDWQIGWAYVYDGGSSRQLWMRKHGMVMGNENSRPVPHYICLWGLPK